MPEGLREDGGVDTQAAGALEHWFCGGAVDVAEMIVIGAGVAGLAVALGLGRGGHDVRVLDAVPDPAGPGSAISLAPNGLQALAALGLDTAARDTGHVERRTATYRPDGRLLTRLRLPEHAAVLGIRREDLLGLLRAAVPDNVAVVEGAVAVVDPAQATVTLQNRTRLHADLVVGADGVSSVVRSAVAPDCPSAVDTGYQVLRAAVAAPEDLATDFGLVWGPGLEIGWLRLPDDQLEWHAQLRRPRGGARCSFDDLLARTTDWAEPVPTLLARTPRDAVVEHGVRTLAAPLATYVRHRVALIGDAAHPVVPNLGQGASLGLEDAVELAAALSPARHYRDHRRLAAGLACYDQRRRRRTQYVAAKAARAARASLLTNPTLIAARDGVLRLTPATLAARPALAHQRWTAPTIRSQLS